MRGIACVVMALVVLAACHEPTAPDRPSMAPARRSVIAGTPGEALAYRSCYIDWSIGGICNLHVRNADGSQSYVVRPTAQLEFNEPQQQSWSRDGTRIAYAAFTDDLEVNNVDIFVITVADGSTVNVTHDAANDRVPAWSPDGTRLAFVSDRGGGDALYVMNADGSNVTRLAGGLGTITRPSWSADGSRIAYSCSVDGNADVCSIGADGTGFTRLTSGPGWAYSPDYSPDGARILFLTNHFAGRSIAVMDADGANAAPLNVSDPYITQPTWSPSAGRIAFVRVYVGACNDYCEDGVYVMNADGSNVTAIASGNGPTWAANVYVPPPADYPPPVAIFTFSCTALSCAFDGNASYSVHQNTGESWTFGDGGSASSDNTPTHTYAASGTYTVTLTVTDELGQTTLATHEVTVAASPPPPPPNQAPVARMTSSCTALTCTFDSSTSTDDQGVVSRLWTFGDGAPASSAVAPTHSYAAGGTYTVTLTVTDAGGLANTTSAQVTVTAPPPPPPPPPPPDQPPVARFTWSCSSTSCTLDARTSTDDVGIVSYAWNLGRLGTASGAVVTVQVRGKSSQLVALTVKDGKGQSSSVSQTISAK